MDSIYLERGASLLNEKLYLFFYFILDKIFTCMFVDIFCDLEHWNMNIL